MNSNYRKNLAMVDGVRSEVSETIVLEIKGLREVVTIVQKEGPVEDQNCSPDLQVLRAYEIVHFFF